MSLSFLKKEALNSNLKFITSNKITEQSFKLRENARISDCIYIKIRQKQFGSEKINR